MNNGELNLKIKMDKMGWLSKNARYMSPECITKCLVAYKEQFNGQNMYGMKNYISFNYRCPSVKEVLEEIVLTNLLPKDERVDKLGVQFSILEPLLINDMCLEVFMEADAINLLVEAIEVPEYIKNP